MTRGLWSGSAGGFLAFALACLTPPSAASGQIPKLTVEARAGAAVPSGRLARAGTGDGAETGRSVGVGFAFALRGGLYLHLGFGQHRFRCSEGCAGAGDLASTGFDLALRYLLDTGPVKPWLRIGALPYTVEASRGSATGGLAVSDRVWGFEAGGGISFQLSERIALAPGARYVGLDAEPGEVGELALRGWVVDLGVLWGF